MKCRHNWCYYPWSPNAEAIASEKILENSKQRLGGCGSHCGDRCYTRRTAGSVFFTASLLLFIFASNFGWKGSQLGTLPKYFKYEYTTCTTQSVTASVNLTCTDCDANIVPSCSQTYPCLLINVSYASRSGPQSNVHLIYKASRLSKNQQCFVNETNCGSFNPSKTTSDALSTYTIGYTFHCSYLRSDHTEVTAQDLRFSAVGGFVAIGVISLELLTIAVLFLVGYFTCGCYHLKDRQPPREVVDQLRNRNLDV